MVYRTKAAPDNFRIGVPNLRDLDDRWAMGPHASAGSIRPSDPLWRLLRERSRLGLFGPRLSRECIGEVEEDSTYISGLVYVDVIGASCRHGPAIRRYSLEFAAQALRMALEDIVGNHLYRIPCCGGRIKSDACQFLHIPLHI